MPIVARQIKIPSVSSDDQVQLYATSYICCCDPEYVDIGATSVHFCLRLAKDATVQATEKWRAPGTFLERLRMRPVQLLITWQS